jgi:hypothetical protein
MLCRSLSPICAILITSKIDPPMAIFRAPLVACRIQWRRAASAGGGAKTRCLPAARRSNAGSPRSGPHPACDVRDGDVACFGDRPRARGCHRPRPVAARPADVPQENYGRNPIETAPFDEDVTLQVTDGQGGPYRLPNPCRLTATGWMRLLGPSDTLTRNRGVCRSPRSREADGVPVWSTPHATQ